MTRTLTTGNLYAKKNKTFSFTGIWADILGTPEVNGAWLIWGNEKNGKTWFSLIMAEYLSSLEKTLYISGEEGHGANFIKGCRRAGLDANNKQLQHSEYITIEELEKRLGKRNAPRIVFIDNVTIYRDELQYGTLRQLLSTHNRTLFVFLAHAERSAPYTSTAKLIKKLAKAIFFVKGLAVTVSGRVPGGVFTIDEHSAKIFHGDSIEL